MNDFPAPLRKFSRTELKQRYSRWQLHSATVGTRLHAAASLVVLGAVTTTGPMTFLKNQALPLGVLFVGVGILFGAHKKNYSEVVQKLGIVAIGLGVCGIAAVSMGVGDWLRGQFWTG